MLGFDLDITFTKLGPAYVLLDGGSALFCTFIPLLIVDLIKPQYDAKISQL
jgi:hypothetical protein